MDGCFYLVTLDSDKKVKGHRVTTSIKGLVAKSDEYILQIPSPLPDGDYVYNGPVDISMTEHASLADFSAAPVSSVTQEQWDRRRKVLIEGLEPEAQTKLLESIAEKLGANIPAKVLKIRQIRAADTIGSELPE